MREPIMPITLCRCGHTWVAHRGGCGQCRCERPTPATPPPGTPLRPEPAPAQDEIPAYVYRAAETAYRHAVDTGIPIAAHLVRILTPIVRQGAYADGRQLGIEYGRHLAADAIQQWADTCRPWDWAAPHVVDGAIAAARGHQADERADRG